MNLNIYYLNLYFLFSSFFKSLLFISSKYLFPFNSTTYELNELVYWLTDSNLRFVFGVSFKTPLIVFISPRVVRQFILSV
jgi:hypothetical protein